MTDAFQGSCLCGEVRFEVDGFLPQVAHCHCRMCRKFHGAGFATFASVTRSHFRWLAGESSVQCYTAHNNTERRFCRHCGSSLTFFSPNAPADEIEIAISTIDGDIPVQPDAHIFVGSAANWLSLEDGLPQFENGRGSSRLDK